MYKINTHLFNILPLPVAVADDPVVPVPHDELRRQLGAGPHHAGQPQPRARLQVQHAAPAALRLLLLLLLSLGDANGRPGHGDGEDAPPGAVSPRGEGVDLALVGAAVGLAGGADADRPHPGFGAKDI